MTVPEKGREKRVQVTPPSFTVYTAQAVAIVDNDKHARQHRSTTTASGMQAERGGDLVNHAAECRKASSVRVCIWLILCKDLASRQERQTVLTESPQP